MNLDDLLVVIIILLFKDKVLFLSDCTAQIDPSPEDMTDIAFETTKIYKSFMSKDPNIAFLSFSNSSSFIPR